MKMYRNGKPNQFKRVNAKTGIVTIQLFKWWKPWTWRNGVRKKDRVVFLYEINLEKDGLWKDELTDSWRSDIN